MEYFDDSSKYVFMSNCLRGDASHSDEFTKKPEPFYLCSPALLWQWLYIRGSWQWRWAYFKSWRLV